MTMQELIEKSVKENLDRLGLKPMTPKNVRWVFSDNLDAEPEDWNEVGGRYVRGVIGVEEFVKMHTPLTISEGFTIKGLDNIEGCGAIVDMGSGAEMPPVKPSTEQDLHVSSLAEQEAKLDKIKSALLMIISEHQSITIWNRSLADSISSLREALEEL